MQDQIFIAVPLAGAGNNGSVRRSRIRKLSVRTASSIETEVGSSQLDCRRAAVENPVLSAGAVAIVTEFHVI